MRFLISEKSYEIPQASGLLRYEQDGEPTGTTEQWRLSKTTAGDQILRVDLDARSNGGESYLYHLVSSAENQLQRLVYRYLNGEGANISGNVLFTDTTILNSRKVGDLHLEEELPHMPVLFPTTVGLGIVSKAFRTAQSKPSSVALLDMHGEGKQFLQLVEVQPQARSQRTRDLKIVRVGRSTHRATTWTLAWGEQSRTLWLDLKDKWPMKMVRQDGLTALETRYMRYG